ncbi:MAG: RNA polymerase subunit sigma-24, partial [Actinomycetota bacterium]|nr:RNA polymerase subunit sigma-24 [Actinomycetota bacterium]
MKVLPFEAVLAEHGAVVMRVCRALLGWSEAEDAWSET